MLFGHLLTVTFNIKWKRGDGQRAISPWSGSLYFARISVIVISVIVQCLSYHNSLKASLNCERASRFFHSHTKAKINILSVVVVAIPVKLQIASWQLFCTFMLKRCFYAYSIRVTWRYAGESLWNASTNVVPKIFPVKRWDTKVFALSLGLETRLLNTHSSSSFLHPGTITQISTWMHMPRGGEKRQKRANTSAFAD